MHPCKKHHGLEEGWKFVKETGINKLKMFLEGRDSNVDFTAAEYMELYTTVYNLCTLKEYKEEDAPGQMYGRYTATLDDYVNSTVLPSLREKDDEFLLRELVLRWKNHKIMVRWLSRFFHYLDRFYVERRNLPKLNKAGTIRFRDLVYKEQESRLTGAVTKQIDRERQGEKVDRSLLKNVVDFYVEIGAALEENSMEYYTNDLEKAVIKEAAAFYSRKSSTSIAHDSCPEYMIDAENCLKGEKDRVFNYLHSSSETKLLETVQHELLTVVSSQLLEKENSGCKALLRDDKADDLSRMYRLFSKIPHGLDPVALPFKNHVTQEGMALVKQAEDAASSNKAEKKDVVGSNGQNFIRGLIDLHDKYLRYVETCFCSHALFHKSLKEAFEVFCNKDIAANSSAELLATFLDNILRKAGGESIEETLENVIRLLAYISDKDLFAEFYRKKLARRLVSADNKIDDENDRSIVSKFKQAYGGQFTSKMEGMLNDMDLAKENKKRFREHLEQNPKAMPRGMDSSSFTVNVLTTGFWPTYKSSDYNLPSEMVKCVEVFQDFYKTKTNHRKLTWLFSMGSCTVKGLFDAKTIDLAVSTYQASLLLLFNACEKLSFEEIATQLNLPEDDVMRLLHSLSCAKHKILNKLPESKTISTTDVFEFNPKFTDKRRTVKVPLPPLDDKKKVVEDVEQDRRHAVDAAVVRIMKSRKVLGYQKLVMECVEMLGRMFKPDVKLIKKRIEHLISSDYLERDKEDPNMFKYLA